MERILPRTEIPLDIDHAALREWIKATRWIRRKVKTNPPLETIRISTIVKDHGWCAIEVYPDGDCTLYGGPGNDEGDMAYCECVTVHGMYFWRSYDNPKPDWIRDDAKSFQELPAMGERIRMDPWFPWVLTRFADEWWRIRNVMERILPMKQFVRTGKSNG